MIGRKQIIWICLVAMGVVMMSCGREKIRSSLDLVYVEGGTFRMGSEGLAEDQLYEDEAPAHDVTVSDFMISKYTITVAQFAEFVNETGYLSYAEISTSPGSWTYYRNFDTLLPTANWRCYLDGSLLDSTQWDYPVVHICYYDMQEYCRYLSIKDGRTYRLPTEAEWEFAARGGVKSKNYLYSGSNVLEEVGWGQTNSEGHYHPVGQLKPNELGLYDMSGNVMEMASDYYAPYESEPQMDPFIERPEIPKNREYINARGGSWTRYPSDCRNVSRRYFSINNRGGGLGFRVVCEVNDTNQ